MVELEVLAEVRTDTQNTGYIRLPHNTSTRACSSMYATSPCTCCAPILGCKPVIRGLDPDPDIRKSTILGCWLTPGRWEVQIHRV